MTTTMYVYACQVRVTRMCARKMHIQALWHYREMAKMVSDMMVSQTTKYVRYNNGDDGDNRYDDGDNRDDDDDIDDDDE